MKKVLFLLLVVTSILSCRINYVSCIGEYVAQSKDDNVCKQLKDSAIIYAVFVDAKNFHPWTEFAVNSTLDSIKKAAKWIESQADSVGRSIKIKTIHHIDGTKMSFPERKTGTYFSLNNDFSFSRRIQSKRKFGSRLNHWSDHVAKYVGKRVKLNSTKTGTRIRAKTMETLLLSLQDKYKTDNISLMIFVNGFYQKLPSATIHASFNDSRPEFSIVSTKNTGTIAHEFLHLYGAIDLYPNQNYPNFNFADIQEKYPDEIMRITHKSIDKLMISPITKYYIGWQPNLDKANTRLLYHKSEVLEY